MAISGGLLETISLILKKQPLSRNYSQGSFPINSNDLDLEI